MEPLIQQHLGQVHGGEAVRPGLPFEGNDELMARPPIGKR